jgi:hypothetical protein
VVSSLNLGLTEKREHSYTILATYFFPSEYIPCAQSLNKKPEKKTLCFGWQKHSLLELLMNLFMSN